jgi:short-subunit dehydrogenase
MNQQRVFITGASRGIGKELALAYGKKGCRVMLVARSEDHLIANVNVIQELGGEADHLVCDVSDRDDMISTIEETIRGFGGIDIAILNAGITDKNAFEDFSAAKLGNIFDVNFFSVVNAMEILIPAMKKQGKGIIAGVGSLADAVGLPGSAAYTSSKIALSHLLDAARLELRQHNIRVVNIKPGFVYTDLIANNKYPMPFIMGADKAAEIIISRMENGKDNIRFPLVPAIANYFGKLLPSSLVDIVLKKWKNISE